MPKLPQKKCLLPQDSISRYIENLMKQLSGVKHHARPSDPANALRLRHGRVELHSGS